MLEIVSDFCNLKLCRRYAPLMDQQINGWTVDGVNLYQENPYSCNKQACSVSLDNLSTKSSGV